MPLTDKGKKIMKAMKKEYGKKKGEQVFYASRNKGKIKGVEKLRVGGVGGRAKEGPVERGGGRDPSAQFKDKTPLSSSGRQALTTQRQQARARISPSTTRGGKIAATVIGAGIGIPYIGGKIGERVVDYTMGFSPAMARKKPERKIGGGGEDRIAKQKIIKPMTTMPIEANKQIDTSLINPKDNFFNFVAYNVGGLSGGVRSGPPPKRGPNPNVPPVKMKKGGYKK